MPALGSRRLVGCFALLALVACLAGCAPAVNGPGPDPSPPPVPSGGEGLPAPPASRVDVDGDLVTTRLEVDLASHRGTATITLRPTDEGTASLDVRSLEVLAVRAVAGEVTSTERDGLLHLASPAGSDLVTVAIDYGYVVRSDLRGANHAMLTLTWPNHCGNLFPCQPHPAEGVRFELELSGVPEGARAVYPAAIAFDAPAYMLAWAVGDYRYRELGRTAAGTRVGVYYLPGEERAAAEGTASLRDAFDWMERTYGPYPFGADVASVSAAWGVSAYGGMEHHPYWHVASRDLAVEPIHVHEAAHGWFGNGVRLRCWEDFVLSEGTVSYITARAITVVVGPEAGARVWARYRERLLTAQARRTFRIAWPQTCDEADVERDLFTGITYMKGAFFFLALAERVGAEALDRALAAFFVEHRGEAASMQQLLDVISRETGYDPGPCAEAWLRREELPPPGPCPAG